MTDRSREITANPTSTLPSGTGHSTVQTVTPLLRSLGYGPGRGTKPLALATTVTFLAGGLLVLWSAYIHFHLWDEPNGYRQISVIGPLFLLQSIGGLILGLAVVAVRRLWVAIAAAGFGVSTLIGFLLTVELPKGLFNYKESWSAPFAHLAFAVEIALTAVLLVAGALCLVGSTSATRTGNTPTGSPSLGA
jgi:hypothetical protein